MQSHLFNLIKGFKVISFESTSSPELEESGIFKRRQLIEIETKEVISQEVQEEVKRFLLDYISKKVAHDEIFIGVISAFYDEYNDPTIFIIIRIY